MAVFENFPYTNTHELNLDWIIKVVKDYVTKTDELEVNFEDLKEYVTNYFDNLDIQEEVNNKLQDMYDSGQLAVLIEQFLNSNSLLVFNTTAHMVAGTEFVNDSTAMRLGDTTYNDGKTNVYKIRTLTSSDIIDGVNIIALTNFPTLIAELLPISTETETEKEYIFMTDSYGNHNNASGKNFIVQACEYLGITNYHDFHRGSAGFSRSGDLNFLKVLQDNEIAITDKNTITDIFVFGGANDQNSDYALIEPGIEAFINYVKSEYPNAKIYIGFVTKSFESSYYKYAKYTMKAYSACIKYGATYLTNSEAITQQASGFKSDRVHPNASYVDVIAEYVACLIKDKVCDVDRFISPIAIELNSAHSLVINNGATLRRSNMEMYQKNNVVNITGSGALVLFTINLTSDITVTPEYTVANFVELSDTFFLSDNTNNKGFMGYCNLLNSNNQIIDTVPYTAWIPDTYTDDKPVLNMFLYPKTNVTNVRNLTFLGTGCVNCF